MNFKYILIKSCIIFCGLLISQEIPDSIFHKCLNNFNYTNFRMNVTVNTIYKDKDKKSDLHFIFNQAFDAKESINKNMVEVSTSKQDEKIKYWRHEHKDTSYYWRSMPITGSVKKIKNRNQIKKINSLLNIFEKDFDNINVKDLGTEIKGDKVLYKLELIFNSEKYNNTILVWIDSENYLLIKLEVVDIDLMLLDRIEFFNYIQINNKFFAQKILKENFKENAISNFKISNIKLDIHNDLSIFEPKKNK